MDIVDLLIVCVITALTWAYATAWRGSRVWLRLGLYAAIALGAPALAYCSLAYMQQGYSGMRGVTYLGWPLPICESHAGGGELSQKYPVSSGLNNLFSRNARVHLQDCDITPIRVREDAAFYATILLIAVTTFRLRQKAGKLCAKPDDGKG